MKYRPTIFDLCTSNHDIIVDKKIVYYLLNNVLPFLEGHLYFFLVIGANSSSS